jgi:hypothetical protein
MYSTKVIEAAMAKYEASAGHSLIEIPPAKCEDWVAHLEAKRASVPTQEEAERLLTPEEKKFIRNERMMGRLNFRYWAERYGTIQKDGGGVCKFTNPWGSQEILLAAVAKAEQDIADRVAKGEPVDGILIALHKSRQLGATAIGCLLKMHRETTQRHRRAMCASVDDDKIQELYDRDKLIYDNLPWWLKPGLAYDEKRAHIYFEELDSRILYQVSSQKSGLGVGRQFDIGHLTELSTWVNPESVELDFFPTLPMSISTFALLESTAYGRGNWWHEFTERVRLGSSPRWRYVFIPWYAEHDKYRRQPPEGWAPTQVSLEHAQKVYDTSEEFMGRKVMLSREQLYWWESTRAELQKGNRLAYFFTNWCATPQESFQFTGDSAFNPEQMEAFRARVRPGAAWEITHV